MVTERDWAEGFLAQARADLEAAHVLTTQNSITASGASVFAMLLQMAFEKFAKAALLRSGAIAYGGAKSSHKGASTMVAAMRRQKNLIAPIGGPHLWTAAFEVIEALERAQPSLAKAHGGPQLEYPWASVAGSSFGQPKTSRSQTGSPIRTVGSCFTCSTLPKGSIASSTPSSRDCSARCHVTR